MWNWNVKPKYLCIFRLAEDLIEPEYKKYESQAEFEKIRR